MRITFLSFLTVCVACSLSCNSKKQDTNSDKNADEYNFVVIDEAQSTGEKTLRLSDLVEDYKMVRFENSDSAIFRSRKPAISKNYIAFVQGGSQPVVLFDNKGNFLCNVGNIGQGPGEYSLAYDALINEKSGSIYVTEITSNNVLEYNLNGNFVKSYEIGKLNKPSLFLNPDGSISVVTMSFGDIDLPITAATINKGNDSIYTVTYPFLITNLKDPSGNSVGFENEVWAYRNTPDNTFMMTFNDTLYSYNPLNNIVLPKAFLKEKSKKISETWYVGMELPSAIIYNILGPDNRTLWYDKFTGEVSRVKIINDYLGNASISTGSFRDGYFVQIWEPGQLIERIQERWLPNNDMSIQQKDELNRLLTELDPEDNNIMFIGKLKEN